MLVRTLSDLRRLEAVWLPRLRGVAFAVLAASEIRPRDELEARSA